MVLKGRLGAAFFCGALVRMLCAMKTKNDFTVRPTNLADTALLPAIERSAATLFLQDPALAFIAQADAGISEHQHRQYVAQGTSWVAIDSEQQVLGFLCAQPEENILHILEVSVAQSAQGQGVGKALVQQCCAEAKSLGFTAVTLTTFTNVVWNKPFYEKLGFVVLDVPTMPEFLRCTLRDEESHGFPTGSRCAMRKVL